VNNLSGKKNSKKLCTYQRHIIKLISLLKKIKKRKYNNE